MKRGSLRKDGLSPDQTRLRETLNGAKFKNLELKFGALDFIGASSLLQKMISYCSVDYECWLG